MNPDKIILSLVYKRQKPIWRALFISSNRFQSAYDNRGLNRSFILQDLPAWAVWDLAKIEVESISKPRIRTKPHSLFRRYRYGHRWKRMRSFIGNEWSSASGSGAWQSTTGTGQRYEWGMACSLPISFSIKWDGCVPESLSSSYQLGIPDPGSG